MKSSEHVKTCFVTGNDDFDDKLTYIYCFLHEKYFLDKNPKKRTLWIWAEIKCMVHVSLPKRTKKQFNPI